MCHPAVDHNQRELIFELSGLASGTQALEVGFLWVINGCVCAQCFVVNKDFHYITSLSWWRQGLDSLIITIIAKAHSNHF